AMPAPIIRAKRKTLEAGGETSRAAFLAFASTRSLVTHRDHGPGFPGFTRARVMPPVPAGSRTDPDRLTPFYRRVGWSSRIKILEFSLTCSCQNDFAQAD